MATLHPSFGPVPEAEWQKALDAPAMKAAGILRRYAPQFGRGKAVELVKFKAKVTQTVTTQQFAYVIIEAEDSSEARDMLDAMEWDDFDWQDDYGSEKVDDGTVVYVEIDAEAAK